MVLSLLNLEIANPLSEQLLGGVVNQVAKLSGDKGVDTASVTNLSGELRDATFTLDRGVVRQDVTFMLGNEATAGAKEPPKRYAFGFNGDVRLSDLGMNLSASLPVGLLKDKLRGDAGKFLQYAPESFPLSLTGSTTAPKLDTNALFRAIGDSVVKAKLAEAVSGGKKTGDGKKNDADKVADILGGLLSGKKPEEIAADAKRQADAEKQAQADKKASDQSPPANDDEPAKKKKKKKADEK